MSATRAKAIALVAVLQLSVAAAAAAQDPAVTRLFPGAPEGHVTDVAGALDATSQARMEDLAEHLRAATGAEIAVVTLPTIEDRSEAEVALAIGRAWGVGARAEVGDRRRNAGIVVLLVPRQGGREGSGHLRIEVGQGLEGIVTDATAGRVRDLIVASLRGEEYGPALLAGVEALVTVIARGFGVSDSALANVRPLTPTSPRGRSPLGGIGPMLMLFFIFFVMSGAFRRRRRRRRVQRRWRGRSVLMLEAVERVVRPFLTAADSVLGGDYSAVLYGSGARGDFVPGRSDINLILVAEQLPPATLRALGPAFVAWQKSVAEPPLLITRAEWHRATDAFPLELADMRTGYQVLRGADPLDGIRIARADLRQALEREFRGKLLRLRQGYAASGGDSAKLGALAARSAATMLILLRGLLTLLERTVPREPLQLAVAGAEALGVDSEPLLQVVRHRGDARWSCPPEAYEAYLEVATRATRFLDQLQLGDR